MSANYGGRFIRERILPSDSCHLIEAALAGTGSSCTARSPHHGPTMLDRVVVVVRRGQSVKLCSVFTRPEVVLVVGGNNSSDDIPL